MTPNEGKPVAPGLFYDLRSGSYWLQHAERFLKLDKKDVDLHLRRAGFSATLWPRNAKGLNELEHERIKVQLENHVDYAGPLAGHKCGLFKTTSGLRILVTSEARPPIAEKGTFPFTERFLETLFANQLEHALTWLKCSRASLLAGDFAPGQMLSLAGDSGCGKSLFQAYVTEFLGGRSGRPYRYMTGRTEFNDDLAASEHHMIEDENASTSLAKRRWFGTRIKEFVVNKEMSVHGKNKAALTLPTYRRLTLSVNCEPENLMIHPPMDASLMDKITILKCEQAEVHSERKRTWNALCRELPAFSYYLERYSVPFKLRDTRYGSKAFQNPELMTSLSDLSFEMQLLNLIDEVLSLPWSGSSESMEQELLNSKFSFAASRLLDFPGAGGTFLGRLRKTGRVSSIVNNGKTRWTIC